VSSQAATATRTTAATPAPAAPVLQLQRTCQCGQHTLGGECDDCKNKTTFLRRSASGRFDSPKVPPVVGQVLRQSGRPLDYSLRAAFEPYFGQTFRHVSPRSSGVAALQAEGLMVGPADDRFEQQAHDHAHRFTHGVVRHDRHRAGQRFDFSHVRVHNSPMAAEAARAVSARAFTVGEHIVFGDGQYAPASHEGQALIAHELTHVMQQQHDAAGPVIQRATALQSIGRFFRNVFLFIPYLFGMDMPFSDAELLEYLEGLTTHIEGGFFSDDKARAVVKKWKKGVPEFSLGLPKKMLLIMEMLDGSVTDGDREGILDLLEGMAMISNTQLDQILGPGMVSMQELDKAFKKAPYSERFNIVLLQNISIAADPLAIKILQDIRDVKQGKFDFENLSELHDEVFKRLRISQMMDESQNDNAFDYPENMKETDHCPGFVPGTAGYVQNARVNLDARSYWTSVIPDPKLVYYFDLTPAGKANAFDALQKLFTPQTSICNKTLIHCDYLINVIEFRAYAETIGQTEFNKKVKDGAIAMVLSYSGFSKPGADDPRKSPKAFAYQNMVPASKDDLVIGDHVTFWNHLAYDGLNITKAMPWRLENAILVDKDEKGKDLFEGHGTPRRTEHEMLGELADAYNPFAQEALNLARAADAGDQSQLTKLHTDYPGVSKPGDKWVVTDPGIYDDLVRRGRQYELRTVDKSKLEDDPLLIGLRDPHEPSRMGSVERPVESAPGPAPRP
jgi:uncharacterized protein DUF4157